MLNRKCVAGAGLRNGAGAVKAFQSRAAVSWLVLLLGWVLLGWALPCRAQKTVQVPAGQPTIQAGIDAAQNGDTVLVAPGTYLENIDYKGKAITVIGSGGAAKTIIDGGSKGPVVVFINGEQHSSLISGFTIQNAGQDLRGYGAGIHIQDASPSIVGNIITHNTCQGVHAIGSAALIQNNEISFTRDPITDCSF